MVLILHRYGQYFNQFTTDAFVHNKKSILQLVSLVQNRFAVGSCLLLSPSHFSAHEKYAHFIKYMCITQNDIENEGERCSCPAGFGISKKGLEQNASIIFYIQCWCWHRPLPQAIIVSASSRQVLLPSVGLSKLGHLLAWPVVDRGRFSHIATFIPPDMLISRCMAKIYVRIYLCTVYCIQITYYLSHEDARTFSIIGMCCLRWLYSLSWFYTLPMRHTHGEKMYMPLCWSCSIRVDSPCLG